MEENNLNQNNQMPNGQIQNTPTENNVAPGSMMVNSAMPNNTIQINQGVATTSNQNFGPATPFLNNGMYQAPNMGNVEGQPKSSKKMLPLIIAGLLVVIAIVIVVTMVLENKNGNNEEANKLINENTKTLIVYFSHDGENYGKNLDYENKVTLTEGNTEVMSKMIASYINADLFELEPEEAYPDDLEELYRISRVEINKDTYPEYKGEVSDLDSYDVIFIGYPIWHNTYPQIVKAFMKNHKDVLKNKIIVPFNTHAGSGSSGTYKRIFSYVESAEEKSIDGLALNGMDVKTSEDAIKNWLTSIGYTVK